MDHPKSAILTFPPDMRRFSGLISRWMMLRECKQLSPSMTCRTTAETNPSLNLLNFLSFPQSSPQGACQRIRQMEVESQKQPNSLRMLAWLREDWMMIYLLTCSVKLLSSISALSMRLRATTYSDARSLDRNTSPNLPFPRV